MSYKNPFRGPCSYRKYPLISSMRWVGLLVSAVTTPFVPAGANAAFATIAPSLEFRVDTPGIPPLPQRVSNPSSAGGTTVALERKVTRSSPPGPGKLSSPPGAGSETRRRAAFSPLASTTNGLDRSGGRVTGQAPWPVLGELQKLFPQPLLLSKVSVDIEYEMRGIARKCRNHAIRPRGYQRRIRHNRTIVGVHRRHARYCPAAP